MRYKVPQDVQREDQILWFLTLRQVIILILGFGLSYFLWSSMSKNYDLNQVETILVWIPAALAAAISFLKIHGISVFKFVLLQIEQNMFRPPRRRWIKHAGEPFVSMTTPFTMSGEKKKKEINTQAQEFSEDAVRDIAKTLDNSGLTEKTKTDGN